MKQPKILSSKAAFNSIVTVVITQINRRQTSGDGVGWKHCSKLKHYEPLTSGHFLPVDNHSRPLSAYYLSVGTVQCDTQPWNMCTVTECKTRRATFTGRHVLTSVCTRGGGHPLWREQDTGTETDRSVLLTPGSPLAAGSPVPGIMLCHKANSQ